MQEYLRVDYASIHSVRCTIATYNNGCVAFLLTIVSEIMTKKMLCNDRKSLGIGDNCLSLLNTFVLIALDALHELKCRCTHKRSFISIWRVRVRHRHRQRSKFNLHMFLSLRIMLSNDTKSHK